MTDYSWNIYGEVENREVDGYVLVGWRQYPKEFFHGDTPRTPESHPYSYDAFVLHGGKRSKQPEKLQSVYSDRMAQWDRDKYDRACKKLIGRRFNNCTPREVEAFLTEYFGKECKLWRTLEWCNASNGYPFWSFEFEEV